MRSRCSRGISASLVSVLVVVALAGVLGGHVAPRPAAAQVQVDEQAFVLAARLCPDGYEDAAYEEECTEPIAGFAFDVAGPVNTEATTGEDGRIGVGTAQAGTYFVEALDFDPDTGFTVFCERSIEDGTLPVDLEYTDAGFEVDLEAELAREIPSALDPQDGVTCTWYAIPGVPAADPDERPGVVRVLGVSCPPEDNRPSIVSLEPGQDATELETVLTDCDPAAATVTLSNTETDDETAVETGDDGTIGAAHVDAGTYTASQGESEPSADFSVAPGEATLVIATTAAAELEATLRPGPTAEPEPPTAAAAPLADIEFGAGEWQDAFPNINTGVYDRSAVAVYGQFSPFPTASLRFDLPGDPPAGATLTIEGLADELGPAQIAITVNGVEIHRGDSGFAIWNPSANTPAWTPVSYQIPAGVLQQGANEITVANLAESAAFGLPPYVLLSVATLTFST